MVNWSAIPIIGRYLRPAPIPVSRLSSDTQRAIRNLLRFSQGTILGSSTYRSASSQLSVADLLMAVEQRLGVIQGLRQEIGAAMRGGSGVDQRQVIALQQRLQTILGECQLLYTCLESKGERCAAQKQEIEHQSEANAELLEGRILREIRRSSIGDLSNQIQLIMRRINELCVDIGRGIRDHSLLGIGRLSDLHRELHTALQRGREIFDVLRNLGHDYPAERLRLLSQMEFNAEQIEHLALRDVEPVVAPQAEAVAEDGQTWRGIVEQARRAAVQEIRLLCRSKPTDLAEILRYLPNAERSLESFLDANDLQNVILSREIPRNNLRLQIAAVGRRFNAFKYAVEQLSGEERQLMAGVLQIEGRELNYHNLVFISSDLIDLGESPGAHELYRVLRWHKRALRQTIDQGAHSGQKNQAPQPETAWPQFYLDARLSHCLREIVRNSELDAYTAEMADRRIETPLSPASRAVAVRQIINEIEPTSREWAALETFLIEQNWVPDVIITHSGRTTVQYQRDLAGYVLDNIVRINEELGHLPESNIHVRLLGPIIQRVLEVRGEAIQESFIDQPAENVEWREAA
jgi:hypothetical protein